VVGNFPNNLSTCPTSRLVTANALPVFCLSVTVCYWQATLDTTQWC